MQDNELLDSYKNSADQLANAHDLYEKLIDKIRALHRISLLVHSSSNKEEVINKILDTIIEIIGFDYAALSLIERNTNTITTLFGRSNDTKVISMDWMSKSRYFLDQQDILPDTVRKNEVQILHGWDARLNWEIYNEGHHENLVRAYIPVPGRNEAVIGVMEVGYNRNHIPKLSEQDLIDVKLFVQHLAVAIENLDNMASAQTRLRKLEKLGLIAQQMVSEVTKPKKALQTITDSAKDLLDAEYTVLLPLSDGRNFVLDWITVAPVDFTKTYLSSYVNTPSPHGLTAEILDKGIVEVFDVSTDLSSYQSTNEAFLQSGQITSFIGIRLAVSGQPVGILYVNYRSKRQIQSEEKSILVNISHLAAEIIYKARIFSKEHELLEDIRKLVSLWQEPVTFTDRDGILEHIVNQVKKLIPNDQCVIFLSDTSGHLRAKAGYGRYVEQLKQLNLETGKDGIVGLAAEKRKTIATHDVASHPQVFHIPNTPLLEIQSMIAVPLLFEKQLLGVLSISRFENWFFDFERDVPLMELISERATNSIKIGFLLAELRQQERKLLERHSVLEQEFEDTWEDRGERYAGHLFYDTIAHDVRNVLHIIATLLEDLSTNPSFSKALKGGGKRQFQATIDRIEQSQVTIVELLELSRTASPDSKNENISIIAERAVRLMMPRIEHQGIDVEINVREKLPLVRVNLFRILEVVLNLLSNSIKALDSVAANRRKITMSTSITDDKKWVKLDVTDTGVGIKREDQDKIFSLYHSWWPNREKTSGMGIGLAVSKRIVEQHGGKISFISRFGAGTSFSILLPPTSQED